MLFEQFVTSNLFQMKVLRMHFENMDYSAIYVHPSNLAGMIKSHHSRPIVKISFNGKSIYRKLRSKSMEGLDGKSVGIDHVSLIELNANESNSVVLRNANVFERLMTYFRKNPNEEIRGAWWYFIIGIMMGIISLIFSIISLLK